MNIESYLDRNVLNRVGVDDDEGPPVPIPNTEVKLISADDTWLATAWDNRKVPTSKQSPNRVAVFLYFFAFKRIPLVIFQQIFVDFRSIHDNVLPGDNHIGEFFIFHLFFINRFRIMLFSTLKHKVIKVSKGVIT